MTSNEKYKSLYKHYEDCFQKNGDNNKGVDWPNLKQAQLRYRIMLDVIKKGSNGRCSLLDFGCGLSHLFQYIQDNAFQNIDYYGLDISPKFIEASKQKFPQNEYICKDILKEDIDKNFDYIVMNGVFTERVGMDFDTMFDFFAKCITRAYNHTKIGMAFNFMSKQVDWEREDLFHLPLDTLAWFLYKNNMKNFIIRKDYGLYEYTVYVYKNAKEYI